MENIIDYQELSDAFQKEWREHPLILTQEDDPPRSDLKRFIRKSEFRKIPEKQKKAGSMRSSLLITAQFFVLRFR